LLTFVPMTVLENLEPRAFSRADHVMRRAYLGVK